MLSCLRWERLAWQKALTRNLTTRMVNQIKKTCLLQFLQHFCYLFGVLEHGHSAPFAACSARVSKARLPPNLNPNRKLDFFCFSCPCCFSKGLWARHWSGGIVSYTTTTARRERERR